MKTNATWALTLASLRMWFRDRQALFWTLVLPVLIMVIFGVLNFGSFGHINLGVIDQAQTPASQAFLEGLRRIDTLSVTQGQDLEAQRDALRKGDRHLVLVLPPGFGAVAGPLEVPLLYNQGTPQQAQVGQMVIREALGEMHLALAQTPRLFTLRAEPVVSRNLRYIDFLVPGVVAMSIMQLGIFSVTFAFVQLKQRGILRRLLATPIQPMSFLFAQVATRLTVSVLQTAVLLAVAILFFDVRVVGNLLAVLILALLGGAVFISMGFAVSGWARTEEVAAPVANLIAMPMMFLSGVFFPRDVMPDILETVTGYLPLTYLGDALRSVATEGSSLWAQGGNLLGLVAWLAVSFIVAVRVFRWE